MSIAGEWVISNPSRLELAKAIAADAEHDLGVYAPDWDAYLVDKVLRIIPGEILSNSRVDEAKQRGRKKGKEISLSEALRQAKRKGWPPRRNNSGSRSTADSNHRRDSGARSGHV